MTEPTYEKHTPSTDALDTLGSIIGPDEKRDAIHLAVEPVIAGEDMEPGSHVSLDVATNTAYTASGRDCVGIVDPFLKGTVNHGERFWLVVYPRQIHSLRHVWEHPAFAPSGETDQSAVMSNQQEAEQWLRDFARNELRIEDGNEWGTTFETFIETALNNDGYLTIYGQDASGSIPDEFWDHLEAYSGKPADNRAEYFSCSC